MTCQHNLSSTIQLVIHHVPLAIDKRLFLGEDMCENRKQFSEIFCPFMCPFHFFCGTDVYTMRIVGFLRWQRHGHDPHTVLPHSFTSVVSPASAAGILHRLEQLTHTVIPHVEHTTKSFSPRVRQRPQRTLSALQSEHLPACADTHALHNQRAHDNELHLVIHAALPH